MRQEAYGGNVQILFRNETKELFVAIGERYFKKNTKFFESYIHPISYFYHY